MDSLAQKYAIKLIWTRRALILIITVLIVVFGVAYFKISSESHQVLREAKNIRVSMRLLSIESYGTYGNIYDATNRNGLADGVAEELAELSNEDGEVTLTAWNDEKNLPEQFSYKKGNYIAYYDADGDKYKTWKVCVQIGVLNYENNEEEE
ncbi:MAG: hypothetical protein K6E13_08155 [Lachnospiraceae bacterium]|nr:hypothetical protein [Lachnospiraceae bacterium]